MTATAIALGAAADALFGDPRRGHPVAGFGRIALAVERRAWAPRRARGAITCAGLVGTAALLAEALARWADRRHRHGRDLVLAVTTWAALGGRSLTAAADAVGERLAADDLAGARRRLPTLVGRDPASLDADGIARATVESVAENTSDAVVGALVWGAVAGPGGVVAFRAANTLDAMVGHRTQRHREYGWAAARLDDAMGFVPARVTVLLAALCAPIVGGRRAAAWRAARADGPRHPSPNAGRVEAAFAGALGVRLGGPLSYAGRREVRGTLGDGDPPTPADIDRAIRLSRAVGVLATLAAAAVRGGRR